MKRKYIYPCLADSSTKDLGFIRLGGAGLANCMFVAARAYTLAKKYNLPMLNPTWEKFSLGPYVRKEKDKRNYFGLFKKSGISGLKKWYLLNNSSFTEDNLADFEKSEKGVMKVVKLRNYFQDLDPQLAQEYFAKIVKPNIISKIHEIDFSNKVAVHVRLGDYSEERRVSLDWYKGIIESLYKINKKLEFLVFSDGTDEELKKLIDTPQTKRVFLGNALADMFAISKCKLVIASDSTFSAWGAFLGKVPIIFFKRHFPPVYNESEIPEFVLDKGADIPNEIRRVISE